MRLVCLIRWNARRKGNRITCESSGSRNAFARTGRSCEGGPDVFTARIRLYKTVLAFLCCAVPLFTLPLLSRLEYDVGTMDLAESKNGWLVSADARDKMFAWKSGRSCNMYSLNAWEQFKCLFLIYEAAKKKDRKEAKKAGISNEELWRWNDVRKLQLSEPRKSLL